jgi:DNA repair protein RadC
MSLLNQARETAASYGVQFLSNEQLLAYLKLKPQSLEDLFTSEQGKAILSLVDRYKSSKTIPTAISSSRDIYELYPELRSLYQEEFWVTLMSRQNKVLKKVFICRGTSSATAVCIQSIARAALKHNAQAIVLVHNHPSGTNKPSEADRQVTNKIKSAMTFLEISVLDHVIVAGDKFYSFSDEGII